MSKVQAIDPQNMTASLPVSGPVEKVPLTPMDMLARAVASGADIEVLEKLMGLEERWRANQSRMAFDEAVAAAKAEIPVIIKNASGHNNKRYANFAAIAKTIDPVIGNHGLSYRFRTAQTDKAISVTCILSHKSGHFEETTLSGPADASGSKNAIQAIGSTLTYLQRYSLVQMLGLAASEDDDGNGAGRGETITDDQLMKLEMIMQEVGANFEAFCKLLKVESLDKLPSRQFDSALALLNLKKEKKK
jgi:hypothetical protein